MIFVDTGAWFASFVASDLDHAAASAWLDTNTHALVTTDYVIDELLTLLKIRGEFERALEVGPPLLGGAVCRLEWVTSADVAQAWQVFATYLDKGWSFTNCDTAGEFVWAIQGAGFQSSRVPKSSRLRLIGRRREFASSINCVSRVVIERLGIATAFAFDAHFRQFGTLTVVP